MVDLKGLFSKEAIVRHLKALPVLKTPVMDSLFTDRPQHPLPLVGAEEILEVVRELPVVRRGAPSIPATDASRTYNFIEPLPINPHSMVTAADLNNLKLLDSAGKDAWVRGKIDRLRRACRKTTEALASQALTGTISWPVQLQGGGWETYTIAYGSPLAITPAKLWTAADIKVADVFENLTEMEEAIQEQGYGAEVEYWAGKAAYSALFALAENSKTTAKLRIEISDQGINIGGYLVRRRAEKYRDPKTKAMTPVVADDQVKAIAKDAGMKLIYCALDDLDANLQPLPFFAKPVPTRDPSGYKVIGESKPLPVANVRGICDATVL